jgi:hypothetical protein
MKLAIDPFLQTGFLNFLEVAGRGPKVRRLRAWMIFCSLEMGAENCCASAMDRTAATGTDRTAATRKRELPGIELCY